MGRWIVSVAVTNAQSGLEEEVQVELARMREQVTRVEALLAALERERAEKSVSAGPLRYKPP